MSTQNCINIACGDVYMDDWRNFDYSPNSPLVSKVNLLRRLPIPDCYADVVYSSHFIEHIPRTMLGDFLYECYRITKPSGRIRLVLPDLEELCRSYLNARAICEHDKADFIILEMLDQCVRKNTGGELGEFYASLKQLPKQKASIIEFVRQRTGHEILNMANVRESKFRLLINNPIIILKKLEDLYIRALVGMLPHAFRSQNVSLASVGECHAWIYDFHTIKVFLERAGFVGVTKVTAHTSEIVNFPYYPLDITKSGEPRKGIESMYIEAFRP